MKVLSTIKMNGKVYNAGDDITPPENEVQSLVDAGAVEGDATQVEVGSANHPSRFGAGEVAPEMSEETLDAQIAELEAKKKALVDSKKSESKGSDEQTDEEVVEKPFEKMNKRELLEAGKAKGVELNEEMTNKEMVEALNNAQ